MTRLIDDAMRFGRPMLALTVMLGVLALAAALVSQGCASTRRGADVQPASRNVSGRSLRDGAGRDDFPGDEEPGGAHPTGADRAAGRKGQWRQRDRARASTPQCPGAESTRGHVTECQDAEGSARSRAQ